MSRRPRQLDMFKKSSGAHGGTLRSTRAGRGARALSMKHSMHLVLRSSKARGAWSFTRTEHRHKIEKLIAKHAAQQFIKILAIANVGNHLHIHMRVGSRWHYNAFIRAISGAIALAVMRASKLAKKVNAAKDRFWDLRPFTRIVSSSKYFQAMKDYMVINQLEGQGVNRVETRFWLAERHDRRRLRGRLSGDQACDDVLVDES